MTEMIENLPFAEAEGIGARAAIGLICLASDYTIEQEFREVFAHLDPSIAFYQARVANDPVITPESLAAMGPRLTETAGRILPGSDLDVIAYGCTSASTVLGEDAVARAVQTAKPGARVTTPITAAFQAFEALKLHRIAVLTPYRRDVNEVMLRYLREGGIDVPVFGSFNEEHDRTVSRIDGRSLCEAVGRLIRGREVDAVFVSCTSIRLLDGIDALEAEIGLPVFSSNQVLIWHALRLASFAEPIAGFGRLFRQH